MEYGPPPLFNQGVSARARLAFFSLFAAVLIVIDAQVNVLDAVRNGVEILLYPFQRALLLPRDAALAVGEYFTTVSTLGAENERLRREATSNALRLHEAEQLRIENDQLRALEQLHRRLEVPVRMVNTLYESRDPFSRKLVIDHGANDGIRLGGPVLDETGVVGQVTRVFPLTAEVTLLVDKEQSIPVQIVRNGWRAVAFGGAEAGSLELRFLPANADVQNGDRVVTSGLDGMYPAGVPVGEVVRVDRDLKDQQFARVVLRPLAAFSRGRALLVLLTEPPPLPPAAEAGRRQANASEHRDRDAARPAVRR